MQIKTEAIVIHTIRYGESDLIVKLFTKQAGLVSYLLRGILKSKKGKIKPSLFLPFSIVIIDAVHKPKASLKRLIEAKLQVHYITLHQSVIKHTVVVFIAEILTHIFLEQQADEQLYGFLKKALLWLDNHKEFTLFHVFFLLEFTQFLGCYPDLSNNELKQFSLEDACYTVGIKNGYTIEGEILIAFNSLLGINFDDLIEIKMPKSIRKQLLDKVLMYYSFHVAGFKKPKSLSVLETLFN